MDWLLVSLGSSEGSSLCFRNIFMSITGELLAFTIFILMHMFLLKLIFIFFVEPYFYLNKVNNILKRSISFWHMSAYICQYTKLMSSKCMEKKRFFYFHVM